MKYVVTKDTRVSNTQVTFWMKADDPVELSELQAAAALQFGAVPVTGEAPEVEEPDEGEIKERIRDAIRTILDEGDELSTTGVPKILAVRKHVPEATPALRDEVWDTFFEPEQD